MAGARKWTFVRSSEIARQYQIRGEFRLQAPKAYSTAHGYGWMVRVCDHMQRGRRDWALEECRHVAQHYSCWTVFMFADNIVYQSAYRKGWLDQICKHM